MAKGAATREAIIDEAMRQASRLGLEGLSLGPLAGRLKLSKSGLFAHFRSKEALQLGVLEKAIDVFKAQVVLPGAADQAATRLRGVFERYLTWIAGPDGGGGCLFITMAQEYDDRPGALRDRLVASQMEWGGYLRGLVREGIGAGRFRADLDEEQAVFELMGAALSFQHASRLLGDAHARTRALAAFDRILAEP